VEEAGVEDALAWVDGSIPIHIILIVQVLNAQYISAMQKRRKNTYIVCRRPHAHCRLHRHLSRGAETRRLVVVCKGFKPQTWQAGGPPGGPPRPLPFSIALKRKATEGFHSTHCVGFAQLHWAEKVGIDEGPAVRLRLMCR
jgi:hypothetical protein